MCGVVRVSRELLEAYSGVRGRNSRVWERADGQMVCFECWAVLLDNTVMRSKALGGVACCSVAVLREMSGCAVIVNSGRMEDADVKAVKVKVARRSSPTGWPCEAAEGATVA